MYFLRNVSVSSEFQAPNASLDDLFPTQNTEVDVSLEWLSIFVEDCFSSIPTLELDVYGYGGVSMVVEVLTDKITRSVAAVREVVKDYGGKMADPGSFMFKFMRVRVVNIKATNVDKDQLRDIALDAGAEELLSLQYMKMISLRIDQKGNAPYVSN